MHCVEASTYDGTCTVDLRNFDANASCVNQTWYMGNMIVQSVLDIGYDTIEVYNFTLNTGAILNISTNGTRYGNIKFKCYAFIDGNITLVFPERVDHELKNYTLISGPNIITVSNNTLFVHQILFNNSGPGGCEDFSVEGDIVLENVSSIVVTMCSFKCKTNTNLIIGLALGGTSFFILVLLSALMYLIDYLRSPKKYAKVKFPNQDISLSTIDIMNPAT